MKNKLISQINDNEFSQLKDLVTRLFVKICLTYNISQPSDDFVGLFAAVLKKHHYFMTFEQIELAFEYNSIGSLDHVLPKNGAHVDNKVKFSIPDLIKIIKAFCIVKTIVKVDIKEQQEINQVKIAENHKLWIEQFKDLFKIYLEKGEQKHNQSYVSYHNALIAFGLLKQKDKDKAIDYSKRIKQVKKLDNILGSRSKNEVYEGFDIIIAKGETLEMYLDKITLNENGYQFNQANEMPY